MFFDEGSVKERLYEHNLGILRGINIPDGKRSEKMKYLWLIT